MRRWKPKTLKPWLPWIEKEYIEKIIDWIEFNNEYPKIIFN
jgi:hypothetical protein